MMKKYKFIILTFIIEFPLISKIYFRFLSLFFSNNLKSFHRPKIFILILNTFNTVWNLKANIIF